MRVCIDMCAAGQPELVAKLRELRGRVRKKAVVHLRAEAYGKQITRILAHGQQHESTVSMPSVSSHVLRRSGAFDRRLYE